MATDVRGPFTLVIYVNGDAHATCLTGPSITVVSQSTSTGGSMSVAQTSTRIGSGNGTGAGPRAGARGPAPVPVPAPMRLLVCATDIDPPVDVLWDTTVIDGPVRQVARASPFS